MTYKRGEFMKKLNAILTLITLSTITFGVLQKRNVEPVKVDAASETKRIWLNPRSIEWDWWVGTGTLVTMHYWGGDTGSNWPGTEMLVDANNTHDNDPSKPFYYLDVDPGTTTVKFTRAKDPWVLNEEPYNKSKNIEAKFNIFVYELKDEKDGGENIVSSSEFTPKTTKIVADFAASINTQAKACSQAAVNTAVSTYNNLSTFERNQFDNLQVGDGFTGLQRLQYLMDFYGITTPLGAKTPDFQQNTFNFNATILISSLGLVSLAGYYFLSRKKKVA